MRIDDVLRQSDVACRRLPEAGYRMIPSLNPSVLCHGLRGVFGPWEDCQPLFDPYAVKHAFESPAKEPTDAMIKGTLAHMACFEPHRLALEVVQWTGGDRRGDAWKKFKADNAGKIIVKQADYAQVFEGIEKQRAVLNRIFEGCELEQALTWNETVDGKTVAMKGKPDAYRFRKVDGKRLVNIYDLKTTEYGIDDRTTERLTIDKFYREKQALYRRGHSIVHGIDKQDYRVFLVFAQLTPPYGINIKNIDPTALDHMEKKMLALVAGVKSGIENGFEPLCFNSSIGLTKWEQDQCELLTGAEQE